MKSVLFSLATIAAVLSLSVGLGSASPSSQSPGKAAKVSIAGTGLGRILVDGRGHTLYLFAKDKHGKSTCTGACAMFWPPLLASGKPVAGAGVKSSLIGTTRRPDGRLQVTYNHHPLYAFAKDVRKGETNGEELDAFGAQWYAVSAVGAKVENDTSMSGGYSTGYGY
jgi:predicted lipoprotein with Yx(FWY)xxD motif